jgi:hypothetical protein
MLLRILFTAFPFRLIRESKQGAILPCPAAAQKEKSELDKNRRRTGCAAPSRHQSQGETLN